MCVWGEVSLKCILINFAISNLSLIYFWKHKHLKIAIKTVVCVLNNLLNLCLCVVNSQRLFCSQKLVLNDRIKAFLYTKPAIAKNACVFPNYPVKRKTYSYLAKNTIFDLFIMILTSWIKFFLTHYNISRKSWGNWHVIGYIYSKWKIELSNFTMFLKFSKYINQISIINSIDNINELKRDFFQNLSHNYP